MIPLPSICVPLGITDGGRATASEGGVGLFTFDQPSKDISSILVLVAPK